MEYKCNIPDLRETGKSQGILICRGILSLLFYSKLILLVPEADPRDFINIS